MSKPKVVIVHGAICGGCDVELANSTKALTALLESYELSFWSVAVDGRLSDLKSLGRIDVAIFMGGMRTEEDIELARWLRERSNVVVAFGSCAAYGGIPGLAALMHPEEVLSAVKSTVTTVRVGGREVGLPELPKLGTYRALPDVVAVDVVVPGCPPPQRLVEEFIDALPRLLEEGRPAKPIVIAGSRAQCDNCPRKPREPSKLLIRDLRRLHEVRIDEGKCFLEQGLLCLGPVTRDGCDHCCIKVNMPCAGCLGPLSGIEDVGLRYIAGVLALVAADRERELLEPGLARILDKLADRLGTLYRYTLPLSRLYKLKLVREGVGRAG